MTFTALAESFEHLIEQRETQALTVRAGVNYQIADERAGPALRNGHHTFSVLKNETQRRIKLGISLEGIEPSGIVCNTTAAVLATQHQQLVNGRGVLPGEFNLTHGGGPARIMECRAEVAAHQPVMRGGGIACGRSQIP